MAIGMRPKLGLNLQSIVAGDRRPALAQDRMDVIAGAPKPQGGFFKEGGMGRYLAGAIGDALAQAGGMKPVFAPMMQQRAADEREEAQWSRRRSAERDDKKWEWANKPKEPLIREDNAGNVIQIDPLTGQSKPLYVDRALKRVFVPDGMGGGQFVETPNPYLGNPAPAMPPRRLGPVVDKVPGGGVSNGTGGFRY